MLTPASLGKVFSEFLIYLLFIFISIKKNQPRVHDWLFDIVISGDQAGVFNSLGVGFSFTLPNPPLKSS